MLIKYLLKKLKIKVTKYHRYRANITSIALKVIPTPSNCKQHLENLLSE